jgi:hypothetical protein
MTDEQSPRETEDEQPEVEGHKQATAPEFARARGEQEEPDVEGHFYRAGPERALGSQKTKGPEKAG